jgi:hypothetical protein
MWRLCTPLLTSEKLPGCIISPLSVFKNWSHILLIWILSLSAPNFEETLLVVIKHGGTAETAISGMIETIDSITNHSYFLLTKWSPQGEMVKESNIFSTNS